MSPLYLIARIYCQSRYRAGVGGRGFNPQILSGVNELTKLTIPFETMKTCIAYVRE